MHDRAKPSLGGHEGAVGAGDPLSIFFLGLNPDPDNFDPNLQQ